MKEQSNLNEGIWAGREVGCFPLASCSLRSRVSSQQKVADRVEKQAQIRILIGQTD